MHLLRVQGFYFVLLQYSNIQAFTARFVPSMQLYRPHRKTAHRALQGRFRPFSSFCRSCVAGASAYAAPPAPRWSVSQRRNTSSAYQIPDATLGRCIGQHSRHTIIRYIRVQGCAPVMDPCQTVQHIADHASPARSRCFTRPAACNLAPGQPCTLHPAGQSSSRGATGGAEPLTALAVALFRAFAR